MDQLQKATIEENCESLKNYLSNSLDHWDGSELALDIIAESCFSDLDNEWTNCLHQFTDQSDKNFVSYCYGIVLQFYKNTICPIYELHNEWEDYRVKECFYLLKE